MNKLNDKEILNVIGAHSKELKAFGVQKIGLFGSYVRNENNEQSDVDILVDLKKEQKTLKNFLSLAYFLEKLLNAKVDLISKDSLSPYIGPHILSSVKYASFSN
jgi:predicted nucleotidyltransferase